MALPVLDGNQTATTLSSVVTGGEHIVAHSVVSLGANAIANITSAVSGSVVSISNFPSTQTIAGTVTANGGNFLNADNALITKDSATNVILLGGLAYSTTPTLSAIQALRTQGAGTLRVYQEETNWTDTNQGDQTRRASQQTPFPVQVLGGSVTIGSLPAISGTVTIGAIGGAVTIPVRLFAEKEGEAPSGQDTLLQCNSSGALLIDLRSGGESAIGYDGDAFLQVKQVAGSSVTIGSLPAISGTVTANNPSGALTTRFGSVTTASLSQLTSCVTNTSRKYLLAQNISAGTVTIGIGFSPTTTQGIQLTAGAGLTFDAFCPTGAVYWLGAVTGAAFTILEG